MKGFKFVLEYKSKSAKNKATRRNPGIHGDVVAVPIVPFGRGYRVETVKVAEQARLPISVDGELYLHDTFHSTYQVCVITRSNGEIKEIAVDPEHLEEKCKRISEPMARKLDPELFQYLTSKSQSTT